MGFMDKVKAGASTAMVKAQQGMAQGQEKIEEMQAKRAADALLRALGAAYYAQQRTGGPSDAVASALAAVDEHVAKHGPIGEAAPPESTDPGTGAPDGGAYPPPPPPPAS